MKGNWERVGWERQRREGIVKNEGKINSKGLRIYFFFFFCGRKRMQCNEGERKCGCRTQFFKRRTFITLRTICSTVVFCLRLSKLVSLCLPFPPPPTFICLFSIFFFHFHKILIFCCFFFFFASFNRILQLAFHISQP